MYSRAYKSLVSLPPLLWVGLFLLLPYALMLAHSFWAVRDGLIVHQWNLQNYRTLATNAVYAEVLLRSMRIAASSTWTPSAINSALTLGEVSTAPITPVSRCENGRMAL